MIKKLKNIVIFLIVSLLAFNIIFKLFPKIGLYSFLFDRGDYQNSYPSDQIITDLNELTPKTKEKAELFIEICNSRGLYPKITETYRTQERQDKLYQQGRTTDGPIVTWVKVSRHTKRYAFDICKDGPDPYGDVEFFRKCAEIGRDIGLTPGYYWTEFQDMPHYQFDAWWTP